MALILVTWLVFQLPMSWLKLLANENMSYMLVTLLVSQLLMS